MLRPDETPAKARGRSMTEMIGVPRGQLTADEMRRKDAAWERQAAREGREVYIASHPIGSLPSIDGLYNTAPVPPSRHGWPTREQSAENFYAREQRLRESGQA